MTWERYNNQGRSIFCKQSKWAPDPVPRYAVTVSRKQKKPFLQQAHDWLSWETDSPKFDLRSVVAWKGWASLIVDGPLANAPYRICSNGIRLGEQTRIKKSKKPYLFTPSLVQWETCQTLPSVLSSQSAMLNGLPLKAIARFSFLSQTRSISSTTDCVHWLLIHTVFHFFSLTTIQSREHPEIAVCGIEKSQGK